MRRHSNDLQLEESAVAHFKVATLSERIVAGLTHDFYRYPARFSPAFAEAAINTFTKPGDLVFDPFAGGGTSLVAARVLGRRAVGIDINSLAIFVSQAKTTSLATNHIREITRWTGDLPRYLSLRNRVNFEQDWIEYHRNIDCKLTLPIRKTIQLALDYAQELSTAKEKRFVQCGLLRTAQWAFESRKELPSVKEFRAKLTSNLATMLSGMRDYMTAVRKADQTGDARGAPRLKLVNRSTIGIENEEVLANFTMPHLILTSPPYPGVHVLYHRWQVQGRRETPAPYWITRTLDGSGESCYTFGNRKEPDLNTYYNLSLQAFSSIAKIASKRTIMVQILAFSDRSWQLPMYLDMLEQAGFTEYKIPQLSNSRDGRLWRSVPNRKWYADFQGSIPSAKEVVLIHKLR